MRGHSRTRNFNLANWLFGGILALLAVSFWVPTATARRTARLEERADQVADVLLRAAVAQQPLHLDQAHDRDTLHARALRAAVAAGVMVDDLELLPADAAAPARVCWASKHYLFQLAATPVTGRETGIAGALWPALEVIAWPREKPGPAHSVFCRSELAEPAFSRNLQRDYRSLDELTRPLPGAARRRTDAMLDNPWAYRGEDDERWILQARARAPR